MRRLLDFLFKHSHWLLFVLLEAVCLIMLFSSNAYQGSVLFTSANKVAGHVLETGNQVNAYFNLQEKNDALMQRNTRLEQRVIYLEKALQQRMNDSVAYESLIRLADSAYVQFPAMVIGNSLHLPDNYITLDEGSLAGIKPEMGVVSDKGVAGIVYKVTKGYSLVISLLNSKSNLSCKIAGSDYFGFLRWEGDDPRYAYLKDLPRHAEFNLGDSVVTSGYSTVFPEGVMVGTVYDMADSNDGLSYLLKIKLATDFGNISQVRVIARPGQDELQNLYEGIDSGQ
ncbi:MAG: rod shape-determining protein MreC [Bacteroidaceae bacterium]|nr:rod shape-determining protein MreC [Bacteroidaceae bacterium]